MYAVTYVVALQLSVQGLVLKYNLFKPCLIELVLQNAYGVRPLKVGKKMVTSNVLCQAALFQGPVL